MARSLMAHYRILGIIENPTPMQVLRASAGLYSELRWNQCVLLLHWGEDGIDYEIGYTREMFIEYQQGYAEFQNWYLNEFRNAIWS